MLSYDSAFGFLQLPTGVQLEWLTKAVAVYIKQHVMDECPVEIYELCQQYPSLGLEDAAYSHVSRSLVPSLMVSLALILPDHKRVEFFRGIGQNKRPVICLEFLDVLLRQPGTKLTAQNQTDALMSHWPELSSALVVSPLITMQAATFQG